MASLPMRGRSSTASAARPLASTTCCALPKELGLKARVHLHGTWPIGSSTLPLPGIAPLKTGGFLLVAKTDDEKALVQAPNTSAPPVLWPALSLKRNGTCFCSSWSEEAWAPSLARRFDISWFFGAIRKYRHLFTEVLAASFFLSSSPWSRPILPGSHRQGARAPDPEYPRRPRHRPDRDRRVRGHHRRLADRSLFSYDQPHRCRVGARLFRHLLACRSPIFRRAVSATRWRGSGSSKISAISSQAPR